MTDALTWKKSSFSGPHGNCVEFRRVADGVEVRDSKHPGAGTIHYTDSEWQAFIDGAKNDEFDLS